MAARLTAYLVSAIVAATTIAGLIVGAQRDDNDGPVDLIVRNGAVYTADRRGTMAEAIAVRGNQILRVGSNREIERLMRPQTIVVDARGAAVLPGFNDAHVSLVEGSLTLERIDLSGVEGTAESLERIRAWSAANPAAPWVTGGGWSDEGFKGPSPSRHLLDQIVPDRPVLLHERGRDVAWANSRALQLAGITPDTPDPADGTIGRESRTGAPSGLLHGAAIGLVERLVPAPTPEQRISALRAAVAEANALGITSVQTMDEAPESHALYESLRRSGELTLRIYAAVPLAHPLTDSAVAQLAGMRNTYPDDPLFKTGALSIRLDDPAGTGSAASPEPYAAPPRSAPAGTAAFTPDDLNRTARLADAAGWQIVTHAPGARAVRMTLDAYAHAVRSNRQPANGRRHRISGIELAHPADVPRLGPLGVIASMRPSSLSDAARPLGERQPASERASQLVTALEVASETRLVLGSGWPGRPLNPLLNLDLAVTGSSPRGAARDEGAEPASGLELKPAIDAYTSIPAWASFDEGRKGSISPGMLADIVVLTEDIFALPADRLDAVSVAVTIFDGKVVYSRTDRAETAPASLPQH